MTLATAAGSPHLSWPWAMWDQAASGGNGQVTIKNLETGQTIGLAQKPADVAISGTSVAYDDHSSVYLLDDMTQSTTNALTVAHADAEHSDYVEFVSLDDRLVVWESNHDPRVYDRAERRLVMLPTSFPISIIGVYGHTLVWVGAEGLELVDTTTLPVMSLPPAPTPTPLPDN